MAFPGPIDDIAHNIQLAVAPVFLLTGVGSIMSVLTARLGRVIDRARHIEAHFDEFEGGDRAMAEQELAVLDRRMSTVHWALTLCTLAALFVAIVVASLFVGDLSDFDLSQAVAWLFVGAMALLIGGLILFLVEVQIATRSVRVRAALIARTARRWG